MPDSSMVIAHYHTSVDYLRLTELARKDSVICIVDYKGIAAVPVRDVARTCFRQHHDEEIFEISARGISYISAFNINEFIDLCRHNNVEFIEPQNLS